MDNAHTPPFAGLTPDAILDAVESLGLRASGSLLALNSYENRVYQVGLDDAAPLVAKFYRPARWSDEAILEEHAFSQQLAEREIPAVPPLAFGGRTLHGHGGFRFALFERRGGRVPELDRDETLQWVGRFLGRIHALGRIEGYRHRPTLDMQSFGREPVDFVLGGGWLPPELEAVYRGVAEQALQGVARCFERAGPVAQLRLHGDCHVGNLLWTDAGPHFVDFDDSRMGPAVQDLWMLLSGERAEQSRQLGEVLAGYEDFCEFDLRELNLLEALRTLRLLHYSAWLARRWHDPAFPAAFPWFGAPRYWEEQILALREQIALMDEPPLWSC
ncbi:serine/threonine protein kinase [Chromobacterium violaceum]|uniref:serine/threonine protein kinase n=1 Tax=Chromobacterium violaceum TaxID=536 RepID=UPI0009DA6577|nr:serine/threonine protein kinase [Chromobacterium violaceum]MBX9268221.1 serine/threonine protein kinase [Chromobacterium violaceum]OQS49236.1 stress response serine/threonine protein kinase YihE [Chromobacterium violaceum]OQS51630.1 stress response serine/threonine protein kinase YihE [Chromobacterium violaceum]QRO31127.1 serine/threonine protein kinase [Chromobacterium violaceum]QRQ19072.1 serine/threonine protein kinase [Chromobacterium violaceum]